MSPGPSEFVVIAGSGEPLDVPDGSPVVAPIAVFDAEPDADPDTDAVSACEDPLAELALAEPPDVGDALLSLLLPGSLGRPCEATLEANKQIKRTTDIEDNSDRSGSRMMTDYVYLFLNDSRRN